jgi:hypothetical protein
MEKKPKLDSEKILDLIRIPGMAFLTITAAGMALVFSLLKFTNLSALIFFFPSDAIILLMLSVVLLYLSYEKLPELIKRNWSQPNNLDARLATLTQALSESSQIINAIELEMKSRQSLVEKLETQKAIAEKTISLSKEQVDAVSALLSQEVSKQSKADARHELFKDLMFFIAGILVTLALNYFGAG